MLLNPIWIGFCLFSNSLAGNYNYGDVLGKSILFYEAQRTGKLPSNNRIPFRGDSFLNDRDGNVDLTGGYFDAGDHVKFGLPLASSLAWIAWGLVDEIDGYRRARQVENGLGTLKWGTDFLIKAHPSPNEFYCQVGNGTEDHHYWGRPEDWPDNTPRRTLKLSPSKPGSEVAASSASALAAASIVFNRNGNASYAKLCLDHAKQLYNFANKYRGKYDDSYPEVKDFYPSEGYGFVLGYASAWLYRATNNSMYKQEVEKHWEEFDLGRSDGKHAPLQILMANVDGAQKYKDAAKFHCNYMLKDCKRTPKRLVFIAKWGSLCHASRNAFLCTQVAKLGINTKDYNSFAKEQIDYMLGDSGRSYVVGFGNNPPTHCHHRASSCPNRPETCDWDDYNTANPNPQKLTGALVGGPDENDNYEDKRGDYVQNEVAVDYQAGFQSALAALTSLKARRQI